MYDSESMAAEALIAAWTTYKYAPGHGPVAVYRCEECGSYHLTSKGTVNSKLQEFLASGKIEKSREVNMWLEKMRRKK